MVSIHLNIRALLLTIILLLPTLSYSQNVWISTSSSQRSVGGSEIHNTIPFKAVIDDPSPGSRVLRKILAPESAKLDTKSESAAFSITYVPNGNPDAYNKTCSTFPEKAKAAFTYAASIWASIIASPVPITIKACWSDIGSSSILGYSGTGTYRRNFQGAPYVNTWYAGSLANSIAGVDLDPEYYDMHITYNSHFSWYFETDGNPESTKHDFVSVVLHEIAHGLNFSGLMQYSSSTGLGSWGYKTGSPSIYDLFTRDGSGRALTNINTYGNPSISLGNVLKSGNVWFHGSHAMVENGGNRIKIYAPSTWSDGSSYSHLDYSAYNNSINQLMVYAISRGESIHDPGVITRGLLMDLGWQFATSQIPIEAPSSIDATDGTCLNRIRIKWSTSSATDYTLYRCTTNSTSTCSALTTITTTQYDDLTASSEQKYYYRVKGNNAEGRSNFSPASIGSRSSSAPLCSGAAHIYILLM